MYPRFVAARTYNVKGALLPSIEPVLSQPPLAGVAEGEAAFVAAPARTRVIVPPSGCANLPPIAVGRMRPGAAADGPQRTGWGAAAGAFPARFRTAPNPPGHGQCLSRSDCLLPFLGVVMPCSPAPADSLAWTQRSGIH